MNWDDLRYILAIVKSGTVSGAADALKVNATTVSRRLKAMESQLGVRVFERIRDGVVLTQAGEELIRAAEKMQELTHDLSVRIEGLDSQLRGTIRLASVDPLLTLWMHDFALFQKQYPSINIELLSSYSLVNLTKREADIAIRMTPKAPQHLVGRRHAEIYFAVYGSHELAESIGIEKPYENFPWVGWDLTIGRATDNYLDKHAKGAEIVMRVDRMDVMVRALEAGIGVSILPCFVGDRCSRLTRIGDYFEGDTYLWILTHPDLRFTARIRALKEFFGKVIERDLDLIEGRLPNAEKR